MTRSASTGTGPLPCPRPRAGGRDHAAGVPPSLCPQGSSPLGGTEAHGQRHSSLTRGVGDIVATLSPVSVAPVAAPGGRAGVGQRAELCHVRAAQMSGKRSCPLGPTGQATRLETGKPSRVAEGFTRRPRGRPDTLGALWVSSPVHMCWGKMGKMAVVQGGERAGAGAREAARSLAGSPAVTQARVAVTHTGSRRQDPQDLGTHWPREMEREAEEGGADGAGC